MRQIAFLCFAIMILTGCRKEQGSRVDIYLLKSFNAAIDTTKTPVVHVMTNAVLDDTPLVANEDIRFYMKDNSTFILRKNIQPIIQNYGPDKAFAVTVDGQPVYYGKFHPMYLSSMIYGLATITPTLANGKELRIDFVNLAATFADALDKRNDPRIIHVLRGTGRLK
jgi:hypothetical protein